MSSPQPSVSLEDLNMLFERAEQDRVKFAHMWTTLEEVD